MKKFLLSTISMLLCLFCLVSCNNTILPIRIPTKDPKIPENNIVKEIPKYEGKDKLFVFYKLAKQKQKQLDLVIPENGYDSLLVRLWFVYPEGLYQFGELVEIKYNPDNDIQATYTRMRIFINPSREYEQINSYNDSIISTPKGGWDNFTKTLNRLEIVDLPTIEHIPSYLARVDGLGYDNTNLTVACEIATKDKYRFIQYNDFEKHKDIDEVGRMYEFIRFIRSEFNMRDLDEAWYGDKISED